MALYRAWNTRLTQRIGSLHTPIIGAPMANASNSELVSAISKAGSLGMLGAGFYDENRLQTELRGISDKLGETAPKARVPIGIGFLGWVLTASHGSADPWAAQDTKARRLVDLALQAGPCAILMAFGTRTDMKAWCKYIRQRDAELVKTEEPLHLFVTANSVEEAKLAVEECDADIIVLQGNGAGGHGYGASPRREVLLKQVLGAYEAWMTPRGTKPLIVTAGGVGDGTDVAADMLRGADGVLLGTRFLLTPEADYKDEQKQLLLKAKETDTIRSYAFDEARNTMSWPEGIDGRGLYSPTVAEYEAAAAQAPKGTTHVPGWQERQARYKQAMAQNDVERLITWSGTGVGAMNDICPAGQLVVRLTQEAAHALERASLYIEKA